MIYIGEFVLKTGTGSITGGIVHDDGGKAGAAAISGEY